MTQFSALLLNGVSLGALYALIALGFVIIFKSSEVVSFVPPAPASTLARSWDASSSSMACVPFL